MASSGFDCAGHRLGVVGQDPTDGGFSRSASLVDASIGPGGSGHLSGAAQSASHLDRENTATDLGTFASVDARAWRQALASGPLAGPGCGWVAGEGAANKGQRKGVVRSKLRTEFDGQVPPSEEEKSRSSFACEETRTSEATNLDHAVMASGPANALELDDGAFEFK